MTLNNGTQRALASFYFSGIGKQDEWSVLSATTSCARSQKRSNEQILDREGTLGRRLTVDEQAEVIGRHGHPLVTRYRPQRHLIGPIVFPYYWIALKFVKARHGFGSGYVSRAPVEHHGVNRARATA